MAIAAFGGEIEGTLILPDDDRYDEVRAIFNGMIDRRPAAIVQTRNTADIVAAVNFAREHGMSVSVRGGGHGVSGSSVSDGGLMIDLSTMKGLTVDTDRMVAIAEPGLRLGEFVTGTEAYGVVSPTGTVSDTGIAGLTLGAGYGYLNGKYGLAIDNLVGAELVTADGEVHHVSAEESPDLFWAIRGGSGNFGIVSSFELKVYPITQVLAGLILHPFDNAREVLRFYRDFAASAPDELTTYAGILTTPDGHQAVGFITCWCGDLEEGEQALAPLRAFGPPIADLVHPMPYSEVNTLVDDAVPTGLRYYWKQNLLSELSDAAIDVIIEYAACVPSPRSVVLIDQVHGAARRVAPDATAFPHRDSPHSVLMLSGWSDSADDAENIQWTRDLAAAMRPFSTGGIYVNEAWDEKPRAAFGANYERLVEIKNRYDPTNFFSANTNITPTTST